MTAVFAGAAVALLVFGGAHLYRLIAGPSVFDRMVGLAAFSSNTTLVLLLVGLVFGQLDMFVDIALGYALLSFVGIVAAARYFEQAPLP